MAGVKNRNLRKYLGSIKDTTAISLAKVNSGYKELDIAVVKATNHVERPTKERHIRAILAAVSATRHRADVAYCIHALARRLAKTHNWVVALKTLMVVHRALREVDPTFQKELINYEQSRSHMLNMAHFRDDSSASAWDYSAWIRAYALFLEERLECFRVLKYDVETEPPSLTTTKDLDTVDLLEHLPALQQLLYRVLGCQPEGAVNDNHLVQMALSMVASESTKIYNVISDGTVNLVDKFFEMQRHDAIKAYEICQRAGEQTERLSEFYDVCKNLDAQREEKFIKIEQPPASFLQAMDEYVKDAPRRSTFLKKQVKQVVDEQATVVLVIEDIDLADVNEEPPPSPPPKPIKQQKPVAEAPDLLNLDESTPLASNLDEKNALALYIAPNDDLSTMALAPNLQNDSTGWELALVSAPTSNESATAASNLAGGLDKLTLDSLYDDAIRRNNEPDSYNPWEPAPVTTNRVIPAHVPFLASNALVEPHSQQAFLFQHPQHQPLIMNPFGNPYASNPYTPGIPVQAYNPYIGLL